MPESKSSRVGGGGVVSTLRVMTVKDSHQKAEFSEVHSEVITRSVRTTQPRGSLHYGNENGRGHALARAAEFSGLTPFSVRFFLPNSLIY